MSALFCKQQNIETMKHIKNVLMKSLILFAAIYHMHTVLNLLITHEKQKIDKIILLLLKQNRKFKKTVNLRVRRARKTRCTWFKQGHIDEWWKIWYLKVLIIITGRKPYCNLCQWAYSLVLFLPQIPSSLKSINGWSKFQLDQNLNIFSHFFSQFTVLNGFVSIKVLSRKVTHYLIPL